MGNVWLQERNKMKQGFARSLIQLQRIWRVLFWHDWMIEQIWQSQQVWHRWRLFSMDVWMSHVTLNHDIGSKWKPAESDQLVPTWFPPEETHSWEEPLFNSRLPITPRQEYVWLLFSLFEFAEGFCANWTRACWRTAVMFWLCQPMLLLDWLLFVCLAWSTLSILLGGSNTPKPKILSLCPMCILFCVFLFLMYFSAQFNKFLLQNVLGKECYLQEQKKRLEVLAGCHSLLSHLSYNAYRKYPWNFQK